MSQHQSKKQSGTPDQPTPPFPPQRQRPPGLESEMTPAPRWKGETYRPADKLKGKAAIVTGGDSGIGRAVAYFFAREGADVVIACLSEEHDDATETREAIESLGRQCHVFTGDLSDASTCQRLIDYAADRLGRLEILVHNAASQRRTDVDDLSEAQLDRTLKVNVYAYLRLVRAALKHLKPGASIIATGSVVGLEGSERMSDYGGSKGAIHAITKSLALELVDREIRVNCVAPGPVWTPLNPSDQGASQDKISNFGGDKSSSPMQRPAQPEELAPAYVFLASHADSSYVNGAVIPITGGRS